MEVAVLPERRFCVPAPDSHRSVASLDLSASWRSHIPFGRLFSCQESAGFYLSLTYQVVTKKTKCTKDFSKLSDCLHLHLHFSIGTEIGQTTKTFSLTTLMAKNSAWSVMLFRSFYKTFTNTPSLSYWHAKQSKWRNFFHADTKIPSRRKQEGTRSTV